MKKFEYIEPKMKFLSFDIEDIITRSTCPSPSGDCGGQDDCGPQDNSLGLDTGAPNFSACTFECSTDIADTYTN